MPPTFDHPFPDQCISKRPIASCDLCRLQKLKCSKDAKGCKRCLDRGVGCVYSKNSVRSKAFQQLKKQSKSEIKCRNCQSGNHFCSRDLDGCTRCGKRRVECVYATDFKPEPEFEFKSISPLEVRLKAASPPFHKLLESPISDEELIVPATEESARTSVVDPDLLPRVEDYALCWSFLTQNGTTAPIMFSFDGARLLTHFYTISPSFRLISCAVAAHSVVPSLPEQVSLSFYQRARKAVWRACWDDANLETVQCLYFLYLFAFRKGQPMIGRKFLQNALEMILKLRLDVDPDDSPWLLNLTSRQKEERRRAFWASYWSLRWEDALSLDVLDIDIDASKIKPPARVQEGGHVIFSSAPLVSWDCEVCTLIREIKKHNANPPSSLTKLIASESDIALNNRLLYVHSKLPTQFMLYSQSPETLNGEDYNSFLNLLSNIEHEEIVEVLNLNLYAFASVSCLNRPKLFSTYLTALHPSKLSQDTRDILSLAINQSLQSAHRIVCLFYFFLDVSEGSSQHRLQPGQHSFFAPNYVAMYAVFEAIIVLWFATTKLPPAWFHYLTQGSACDKSTLMTRLRLLIQFAKRIEDDEGANSGTMAPIFRCIEEMFKEMEGNESTDGSVDQIVLGMRVVSLSGNADDGSERHTEALAFLGLLGMEVGNRIRWKGRQEEAWRLFWKLNS